VIVDEIEIDVPDSIVTAEMENVLHRFNHSLSEQGVKFDDYLQVTGQSQETFVADLRDAATKNVKTDLLFDAVAVDAGLVAGDDEVAAMHAAVGASTGETASQVGARLTDTQTKALIDDIVRKKAHDELLKAAVPVDHDGNPIDFEVLAAELNAQREEEE
jgi:trigger factor